MNVTWEFLDKNPKVVFVFGDNTTRKGKGGAAALRDHKHSYGFITKRYPNNKDESFYTPVDYPPIFEKELYKLRELISFNPDKIFLISPLGSNLANKFGIYQAIIKPELERLRKEYWNVILL